MKTVPNDQGPRQPRPVYYEPDHEGDVNDTIAGVLHLRGYRLTSDESWLASFDVHAMVIVEGDGSLSLMDGDTGVGLPRVEEFSSPTAYAAAIADWLDGDEKHLPAEKAEAQRTWPVRRSETHFRLRAIRRMLTEAEKHTNSPAAELYRSGSPAVTVRREVEAIVEECQRLLRDLSEPVPDELVESARIELAGVEAIAAIRASLNGGAR